MASDISAHGRVSGIFAPVTALPSEHGIGDLGPGARRFADLLSEGGQRLWQVLPLSEPGNPANSPYDTQEGAAINRWLISPDDLADDGLLTREELAAPRPGHLAGASDPVEYGAAHQWKGPLLERAADRLLERAKTDPELAARLAKFEEANATWLPDYANFMHLKRQHAGDAEPTWSRATWPVEDRIKATANLPAEPTHEMRRTVAEQFLGAEQWNRLREHSAAQGVRIMSDIPFYEGDDGTGPWKRPDLFHLDGEHRAYLTGGASPEPGSAGGAWGMPAYRTENREQLLEHFAQRIAAEAERVGPGGMVRLDHAFGFPQPYYFGVHDSSQDGFRPLFRADEVRSVLDRHPDVTFLVEDLGTNTHERVSFMEHLDAPKMRVGLLAFMEDDLRGSIHFPDGVDRKDIMYTGGTHDFPFVRTELAKRWDEPRMQELKAVLSERGLISGQSAGIDDVTRGLVQLSLNGPADVAVTQVFDALGMGGDESVPDHLRRFNWPGTANPANWTTRIPEHVLSGPGRAEFVDKLLEMARLASRL